MTRRYGGKNTIHQTGHIDVEIDSEGVVVAVWFRCMPLPFQQTIVDSNRAAMLQANFNQPIHKLIAVEIE